MRIIFNRERCNGCYACHIACIDAHFSANDCSAVSFRRSEVIVDPEHSFQKTVCPGCQHCEDAPCLAVCSSGALYREKKTGLVLLAQKNCTACRHCISACPDRMLFLGPDGKPRKCDGCIDLVCKGLEPACVRACFVNAIQIE